MAYIDGVAHTSSFPVRHRNFGDLKLFLMFMHGLGPLVHFVSHTHGPGFPGLYCLRDRFMHVFNLAKVKVELKSWDEKSCTGDGLYPQNPSNTFSFAYSPSSCDV